MKNVKAKSPSIQVYSWATPNGHKVHIMLEECGFKLGRDWEANPVDIGKGDQFNPEFLSISPNNRIPALVDMNGPDGKPISVFESGAILLYLASKTGKFQSHGMAHVSDGWGWSNVGSNASFPYLRS